LLLSSFWVMTITLALIGAWSGAPGLIIVGCFAFFSFFNAISGDLCGVYPSELFPSEVRASGIGLAAAFSRIGAAGGTFLLPLGITHIGIGPSVLIGAALCALGLFVTYIWAPETTGISLTRTSSVEAAPPGTPGVVVASS
jgi:putative MFS transporter